MPTIPQRELRNNAGQVLRRAEAGERFTVTVNGRPVAELGPLTGVRPKPTWNQLAAELPADPDWAAELVAERDAERAAAVEPWG